MVGAQTSKVGLGFKKEERYWDLVKSFLHQDKELEYRIHALQLDPLKDVSP
jgi:hypothetical protein